MEQYRPFTLLGLLLIVSGMIFVLIPIIARYIPNLDKIPWIILWVYKKDGFYFATSPILILISLLSVLMNLIGQRQ